MTELKIALFLHLLGAFLLVSGLAVVEVAYETARRKRVPAEIAVLLGLSRIGVALTIAGALAAFGFGLWLTDLRSLGDAGWIDAAVVLLVALIAIGTLAGQRPRRARELALELARESEGETPELRALLDDSSTLVANYVSALIVLAIIALMVFRPG